MSRVSREVRIEQAIARHSIDEATDEQIAAEVDVPVEKVRAVRKYLNDTIFEPDGSKHGGPRVEGLVSNMSRCEFTYLDGHQCSYSAALDEDFCLEMGHLAIANRSELDDTAYEMERDQQAADAFDRETS